MRASCWFTLNQMRDNDPTKLRILEIAMGSQLNHLRSNSAVKRLRNWLAGAFLLVDNLEQPNRVRLDY